MATELFSADCFTGYAVQNQFISPLSDHCICPGQVVSLECTIVGGGTTVWEGSAFDCSSNDNEIQLRHSQFQNKNLVGQCNDGNILARPFSVVQNNCFTSQLNITVTMRMDGETVVCVHDDGGNMTTVGTWTVSITTGKICTVWRGALFVTSLVLYTQLWLHLCL